MSLEKAKTYLSKFGMENQIMEFDVSSATVALAAIAVGCEEHEIAKSLSFIVNEKPILIIVAGDAKVDNAKYKAEFHTKAKMIPFENVEEMIGHAAGGVCPFGVKEDVTIYLDESLKKCETVYPACGTSNSAIKLTVEKLEAITQNEKWVDVCK